MFNCFKVFYGGRLISVVASEYAAENFIRLCSSALQVDKADYSYEGAFIEGIGF